jgi:hypothetical protein
MRKLIRRPSPTAIIAAMALFFALGGSAYGLVITGRSIKNGTVTGGDIRNGSLASRDVQRDSLGGRAIRESSLGEVPGATTATGVFRQAVVTDAGVLARSRGVSSAARTAEGRYQVIFDRDVRGCAYMAGLGDAGAAAPAAGLVETSSLASNVNGVSLRTQNSAGNPADRPFHLIVSC